MSFPKFCNLPVSELRLNPDSPRFASAPKDPSQQGILHHLWDMHHPQGIYRSMAANGFFPARPLLVVPENGHHTVVDGNRRLAAVAALTSERLQARHVLAPPKASPPEEMPVVVADNRESVWPMLLSAHCDAYGWKLLAQANYIEWIHEHLGVSLGEIEARGGEASHRQTYGLLKVLRQAEKSNRFGFDRTEAYDHPELPLHVLRGALTHSGVREYLGIAENGLRSGARCPVPTERLGNLSRVCWWVFGDRPTNTRPAVVAPTGYICLSEVLGHPEAREMLESGESLDRAFHVASGGARSVADKLAEAEEILKGVDHRLPRGFKGEWQAARSATNIEALAKGIARELRRISRFGKPPVPRFAHPA